ncbi:hypothetical protein TNIN_243631 [Trichonephila inaurata madagascariensis]|uniref:MADF domain-containing protein n=1 Tax=Trichonephila inaurata madagascariensis TaxID=2747483 RepID=A0A8X7C1E0_9ARAC|nr:hypothetical protein TNIN_243631 [Trichonephila inaurata madagascariensis]
MFLIKWNELMESFLIDEIEKLPYLWNPKHPHFTKRVKKKIRIPADHHEDEREEADTRSFPDSRSMHCAKFQNLHTYYRKEKKKILTFRSETGAEDFVPMWKHFARLQFLDDTINPTPLNVSVSTEANLFETIVEPPPIPCSGSQISQLPQGTRVSTSSQKRKVNSNHEEFYDRKQTCFGAVDKKTVN